MKRRHLSASLLISLLSGAVADVPPPPPPPAPAVESKPAPESKPTNRLSKEKSPYLLQHAHNPVDWYPWGEEAFAKAAKENKPILLSIGYSTCHWCHVMERESFENKAIAKYLNEHFVPVKLDREERPDVDSIYMTAMQALQLGGGWPLNVFLTPDRKPFYGGTYFKPEQFMGLLQQVKDIWQNRPGDIKKDADNIASELGKVMAQNSAKPGEPKKEWIAAAAKSFSDTYDGKFGGFGSAPKFPQPQIPELLLLQGAQTGNKTLIDQVLFTCRRMAAGGMYDQLGGGFSRYSVDAKWLVPHFEKMLYDNGQLVNLYLNAHLISGDTQYADVVRDILKYQLRDMTHAEGGFYSAEDADSEGHEGKFYCWTEAELQQALTAEEFTFAKSYYAITAQGNFEDHSHPNPLKGQNILSIAKPDEKLSESDAAALQRIQQKLFEIRAKRVRPHLDDKILVSWNGLMLSGISRAGIILNEPKYLAAAKKNVTFVQSKLWDAKTKTLYHRYRDGERDQAQLLTAYAFYLHGLVDYYQATLDPTALELCIDIARSMIGKFYDEKNGAFFASASEGDLLFRAKDDYDGAEPSGNSMAIYSLLKLAAITEISEFKEKAMQSLRLYAGRLAEVPQAVPLMLQAANFALQEPHRVVLVGDAASPSAQELLRAAHRTFQPNKVILGTVGPVEPFAKTLPAKEGKPTVYICTGTECKPPTADIAKVKEYLTAK
jgi:uncharacterized protein